MYPSCGTRPAWTKTCSTMSFKTRRPWIFASGVCALLEFMIPRYVEEGKMSLVVSIGCTGGQHRSVSVARQLAQMLGKHARNVNVRHRDVARR